MAKQKKKKNTGNTASQKEIPQFKAKSSIKQKLMIGLLIGAMLLFVFGGVIRSFMSGGSSSSGDSNYTSTYERPEPQFRKDGTLSITSKQPGVPAKELDIEIVSKTKDVQQGLMYRKSMEENRGMLFLMNKEEPQSFWMKNTHIPLDIIFINSKKEIVMIRPNTIPYSKLPVPSDVPAKYVLEVNSDYCKKYNVKIGDKVAF